MALPMMTEGGFDPRAYQAWWDERVAEVLELPGAPDTDRAAIAGYLVQLFDEWRDEAIAIRDVEIWRLHTEAQVSGASLSRALGLHRSRGPQLIARAREQQTEAKTLVSKIKRRVRAGNRLRVIRDQD